VARSARQLERAKPLGRDGLRHLALQPWRALHAAVLVGDIDLKCKLAPPGKRFDPPHHFGHGFSAMHVGCCAHVDCEEYPPRAGRLARLLLLFCGN
jgi:hypothetical protein